MPRTLAELWKYMRGRGHSKKRQKEQKQKRTHPRLIAYYAMSLLYGLLLRNLTSLWKRHFTRHFTRPSRGWLREAMIYSWVYPTRRPCRIMLQNGLLCCASILLNASILPRSCPILLPQILFMPALCSHSVYSR